MLRPPIEPMLARPLGFALPAETEGVQFEPKWDGFRCLVFWDGDHVVLQGRGRSKSADEIVDLAYAFPELVAAVRGQLPAGVVLDGEIVVPLDGRLDFTSLGQRLRPRSEAGGSNIAALAARFPAQLLLFDALHAGRPLMHEPLADRRAALEQLLATCTPPLRLTPVTTDLMVARRWYEDFEAAGVDGVIVKRRDESYAPGERRNGKVKHQRTADVVVAGWRPHAKAGADGQPIVGSLLLGLYDDDALLHYMGVASAFPMARRAELRDLLAPLGIGDDDGHPWRGEGARRVPGEANRWRKEQPWIAVRPELVAEVTYDQVIDGRFRHVAGFVRWRPDRGPTTCGFDQLERPAFTPIAGLLEPATGT